MQEKLERVIDKHMRSLGRFCCVRRTGTGIDRYTGASKVSLSSISSQELWEQSGRLKESSEVFRFQDRKEARLLLAPTHEEEITTLVGSLTSSYKSLPLRMYQICKIQPSSNCVSTVLTRLQRENTEMSPGHGRVSFAGENSS